MEPSNSISLSGLDPLPKEEPESESIDFSSYNFQSTIKDQQAASPLTGTLKPSVGADSRIKDSKTLQLKGN
jgi:hypothetical protein